MQETLLKLKEILNAEKCIYAHGGKISIAEAHKQASLNRIHIDSTGKNAFALRLDECGFPGEHLFKSGHRIRRACDAVIFCLVDDEPYILCIELKTSEQTRKDVTEQFQSAHCLLDFLDSVLRTYHQTSLKNWSRRYFLIYNKGKENSPKPPLMDIANNNSPETAMFYQLDNNGSVYLRKMLAKAK